MPGGEAQRGTGRPSLDRDCPDLLRQREDREARLVPAPFSFLCLSFALKIPEKHIFLDALLFMFYFG